MTESRPQVQYITVDADHDGQRIDNFLRTALKGAPKSLVYRLLRKGEVRINKKRAKPDYKLEPGDIVRIPPVKLKEKGDKVPVGKGLLEHLEKAVLYESDALMIINKPSGLAVHGGSGVKLGLIESLRQMRPEQRFLELVHRLDRDTSGCIMVAKKRPMLRHLHEKLRQHEVRKVYHALVSGRWDSADKKVDAPLLRTERGSGERIVKVNQDGKPSVTEFRVLRRFGDEATLVEAAPRTGRTHQIRVHSQYCGHPIIGDSKYCRTFVSESFLKYGIHRLMLHAASLQVELPDGEKLHVEAPLDQQTAAALEQLALRHQKEVE